MGSLVSLTIASISELIRDTRLFFYIPPSWYVLIPGICLGLKNLDIINLILVIDDNSLYSNIADAYLTLLSY